MKRIKKYIVCFLFIVLGMPFSAYANYIYELYGSSLEMISPTPTTYVEHNDFEVLRYSASGDVTANLQSAGLGDTGDFSAFTAGNIALIERGAMFFQTKVENAHSAGASGVLVYDWDPGGPIAGTLLDPTTIIPSMVISKTLGESLLALLATDPVRIHMLVDGVSRPIPEPATMLLLGFGLLGLARVNRRKR